jgi:hypothetical protein
MSKYSNLNWEMMTAGSTTPEETSAAPKAAPEIRVVMVFGLFLSASISGSLFLFFA